jgi:hypothetical protein
MIEAIGETTAETDIEIATIGKEDGMTKVEVATDTTTETVVIVTMIEDSIVDITRMTTSTGTAETGKEMRKEIVTEKVDEPTGLLRTIPLTTAAVDLHVFLPQRQVARAPQAR